MDCQGCPDAISGRELRSLRGDRRQKPVTMAKTKSNVSAPQLCIQRQLRQWPRQSRENPSTSTVKLGIHIWEPGRETCRLGVSAISLEGLMPVDFTTDPNGNTAGRPADDPTTTESS